MDTELIYEIIRNTTRIFAAILLVKYTVFLLLAPFHSVKESLRKRRIARKYDKKGHFNPKVSVLVPAWNEAVGIRSTLTSLVVGSYENMEIIVINDGSTDATDKIVKDIIMRLRTSRRLGLTKKIRYFYKENGGKGRALNYAIERATGDIIVTVDADSIADKDMIKNLALNFADPNVDAVVGNVKVAGKISFINLLQRLEYLFGFYHKRAHSVMGAEYIFGGACAAFRRKAVFDAIGTFDTSNIAEDIELSLRTRHYGLRSVYADNAICYTEGANSFSGLIKQRLRWKKGRFEAFLKYRQLFFSIKAKHNLWLSWFVLPLALLAEVQLLFEPIGLTLLVLYSVLTGDYSSIMLGAIFIFIMYFVVGLTTERGRNWWIVPLAPFTWMMFYVLVWIEYVALLKSIIALIRSHEISWQRWDRKGISGSTKALAPKSRGGHQ